MNLQACADIVRRGDPDRFAAAMAAPVQARAVLFPLYAFNVEVARAPWVASEPMIGEMRLQWWRDALDEIGKGGPVRRHEVTTPLSQVLDARLATSLDPLIVARRWDIHSEPFENAADFKQYLDMTGGLLMWIAAHLLGADAATSDRIFKVGRAAALVRFLQAVPDLRARGRHPLIEDAPEDVSELARNALSDLPDMSNLRLAIPKPARGALIEAWQARALLSMIAREPERVAESRVALSEFRKRASLLVASLKS